MANSKEVVAVGSVWSPGFIEELLPCSQQISLLYHISYLCLAKFSKLERLLRMRAVETQLLFGSSEAILLKCVGTSQNLITSLFPMLILAIEKNKPTLAVKYLEKARTWITDIILDVNKIVERYDVHNKDMATTTSDVITEKTETEKQIHQVSQEIQETMKIIKEFEIKLEQNTKELEEVERQIEAKNQELQNLVRDAASKSQGLAIFAAIVPFIGVIVESIYNAATGTGVAGKVKALEGELNRLTSEKISLKNNEMTLQLKISDLHMTLFTKSTAKDSIPDPVHLGEVQRFLTKIQKILIKLKSFWENVYSLLGSIRDKTFVGEDLIEDPELMAEFVQSIKTASEIWQKFSGFCSEAVQIFRVQSKDAYDFLEIDPASLTPEVWQKEYDSVKEQLLQMNINNEKVVPPIKQ